MALSGDQRALLKLVVERGQSYEDISGLLGIEVGSVRERARGAVAELAGADLDRKAQVTDYLLGQADPIARADVVRHLSRDSADRERAARAAEAIALIAPNATLPQIPDARGAQPRHRTAPSDRETRALPSISLDRPLGTPQRRLVALLGAAALIVVVAVIAIAGGGGEDADDLGEEIDPDFVRVELAAAAGSGGSGIAVIGQTEDDQPFIELDLEGLGEIGQNSTYVLWMLTDDNEGIPVAPIQATDGEFQDRMPLLSPADLVAAFSQSITVAVMNQTELQETLTGLLQDFTEEGGQDEQAQLPVTRYRARTILRGEIPSLAEVAEGAAEGATGESGEAGSEAPAPDGAE